MKKSRTLSLVLSLAICLLAISSCLRENIPTGSTSGKIKAKVNTTGSVTKSSSTVEEELTQTILVDKKEDLYLQEIVSDNLSQPVGAYDVRTKGTVITTDNIGKTYGQFGMEGFVNNPGDIDCAEDVRPTLFGEANDKYIIGGKVSFNKENSTWTLADNSGKEYPWLNNISFSFWSFAPMSHSGTFAYVTTEGEEKPVREKMTITGYENELDAAEQTDLLIAYNAHNYPTNGESVDILFRHALADIYFDIEPISEYDLSVTDITIKDAKSKGDCEISSADLYKKESGRDMVEAGFDWAPNTPADFTMSGYDDHFFMIPQDFEGTIVITLNNGKIVETALKTKWEAGKYYKYRLTYNGLEISIDDEVEGNEKKNVEIRSTANSTVKCYIRALIIGNWHQNLGTESDPVPGDIMAPWSIDNNAFTDPALPADVGEVSASNWVLGSDGFYYYKYPVYPDTETGGEEEPDKLFGTYTAPATAPVEGTYLNLSIVAQAVKWDDGKIAATQAWGITAAGYLSDEDKSGNPIQE